MNLLIDTHAVLWLMNEHEKLPPKVKSLLISEEHELYLSIASLWEMAIKASIGKLIELEGGVAQLIMQLDKMPVQILPLSLRCVEIVELLPYIHRDPFDRVLVATAIAENMAIITADEDIKKYDVLTVW